MKSIVRARMTISSIIVALTIMTSCATQAPKSQEILNAISVPKVIVYITKTGEKYHRENCQYLRQSKIEISLDDAIKNGYDPCSVCKPPTK
jgi:hypothetical protein